MGRLALVGGTGLLGVPVEGAEARSVRTGGGAVEVLDLGDHCLVQRHGAGRYRAPHGIDYAANLAALAELGCDRVLGIGSVGSLRREIPAGSFVCPDDFIALQLGGSSFDDERGHLVPGFDPGWRGRVVSAWPKEGPPLADGGIYWQAIGPRLETPAEVRLISAHADVVGMTIASECLAANEAGLPYAAVCVVDNLANGLSGDADPGGPLTLDVLMAGVEENRPALLDTLGRVVPELAA